MITYDEGDRVIIVADPDNDLPEERGEIEGTSGIDTYIVRVDSEFREDEQDDCLREVDVSALMPE